MTPDIEKAPRVQAIVVLYRCASEASPALQGLLAALRDGLVLANEFAVLVYDNSPEAQAVATPAGIGVEYIHDPGNGGLLPAYQAALESAQRNGAEWLLLLDQDTQVSREFIQTQLQITEEVAAKPGIAASVPHLRSAGRVQSPHGPSGWSQAPLAEDFNGPAPIGTTAFNSGAMLRRSAIEAVGGFPTGYPIDFLDHAIFARLARAGMRVWVISTTLVHAMTWEDPARLMSLERFAAVLAAEGRFHREYSEWTSLLAFRLRCARRAWKYRDWPDKRYAQACWQAAIEGRVRPA